MFSKINICYNTILKFLEHYELGKFNEGRKKRKSLASFFLFYFKLSVFSLKYTDSEYIPSLVSGYFEFNIKVF